MLTLKHAAVAAAAVAVFSLGLGAAVAGGKGKPTAAKSALAIPTGGPDVNAKGDVDWKHFPATGKRAERSWLRLRLGHLDGTDYTLWMDDPSTVGVVDLTQVAALTASGKGGVNFKFDTKDGDTLPFGATLAALEGMAVEIRDSNGVAVLAGTEPATPAPKPHPHH